MPASYTLSQHDPLDEVMDKIGHGRFHIFAVIGLGCRLFVRGSIFSLRTMFEPYFKCKYDLSYFAASFYITSYLLCAAISAPLNGWLANKYGKRKTLLLCSSMTLVTAILHILSSSFTLLVITMAGCGVFDSAQFLVYPFILEFFCKSGRKHVSSVELFYVLGYASGVIVGYLCLKYLSWQWAIVICVIIPLIPVLISLAYLPESPRYLLANGDRVGAIKSLVQMSLTNNPGSDKRELLQTFTKTFAEPTNKSEDRGCQYDVIYDGDDYHDDVDDNNSQPSKTAEYGSSNERRRSEKVTLLGVGNFKMSNKDLRQRVLVVCVMAFMISASRNAFLFASGQSYDEDHPGQQCSQCSSSISFYHLISVTVGSLIAILISYNLVGRLKRRLALRGLITVLAIAIIPFYFDLPDWVVSGSFFIVSVVNECLMLVRLVYCSEVVPSSVRGFASNLMFGFGIAGALTAAFMATYVLHVSHFLTFFGLHIFILICLIVVYRYVIETKDMSLN